MRKEELIRECTERDITAEIEDLDKPQLQALLTEHLHGIQRVPALMINSNRKTLGDLNLSNYEIIPTEPLHDLKEHIKNILTELPELLSQPELEIFNRVKEAVVESKDKLRGCDYRFWAVTLALQLNNKARLTIAQLLGTLAELSELCYASAEKRTPKFILRFHNVAFLHAQAFLKIFTNPKNLTLRKMYGVYWHSLTVHAPVVSRIISLNSVNTEEEEETWSHHPQQHCQDTGRTAIQTVQKGIPYNTAVKN